MSSGIALTNNEIKDIMKVITSLENRGILLKETTTKITSQEGEFLIFLRPLMTAGLPLIVINELKSEMDLDISPGDIDRTHRIGVPSKGRNRPIIIKFVRYLDSRRVFTNKKRLNGKNISITESLTKIRMSAFKEARNKFGYSNV